METMEIMGVKGGETTVSRPFYIINISHERKYIQMADTTKNPAQNPAKPKTQMELLMEAVGGLTAAVTAQNAQIATLQAQVAAAPKAGGAVSAKGKRVLFGGKKERNAIKDTTTGIVYVSKSAVGKALAQEAGTTKADNFAWYKLMAKFPNRFVDATAEEKATADKKEADRIAAEVAEMNKKLEADAAAAAKK